MGTWLCPTDPCSLTGGRSRDGIACGGGAGGSPGDMHDTEGADGVGGAGG